MSLNVQLVVGAASFMAVAGGIILWAKLAFNREFPVQTDQKERQRSTG